MRRVIKVEDLFFAYGNDTILENINLKIEEGDFIAFIGPNGSGKSTLLKLLTGSLKATAGEITLLNQDIKDFNHWSSLGYVSQKVRDFNQSFPATVKEVVAGALYQQMGLFKILTTGLNKKIDDALNQVGMLDYKDHKIGQLSGGQQQRVFIARTLIKEPQIIFLDEPLVGVDAKAQGEFYQLLTKLNQELGITIVMISHDIYMISDQANKIVCFANKQIHLHRADEFDYINYLNQMKGQNNLVIPKHQH